MRTPKMRTLLDTGWVGDTAAPKRYAGFAPKSPEDDSVETERISRSSAVNVGIANRQNATLSAKRGLIALLCLTWLPRSR
jgi:hypothetical protein